MEEEEEKEDERREERVKVKEDERGEERVKVYERNTKRRTTEGRVYKETKQNTAREEEWKLSHEKKKEECG